MLTNIYFRRWKWLLMNACSAECEIPNLLRLLCAEFHVNPLTSALLVQTDRHKLPITLSTVSVPKSEMNCSNHELPYVNELWRIANLCGVAVRLKVNTEHGSVIQSIHQQGFLQAHYKVGGALTPGVLAVQRRRHGPITLASTRQILCVVFLAR